MRFAEIFAASIVLVVLYNAMQLASTDRIDAAGSGTRALVRRIISPAVPLVDYPPGHPNRQGA